MTAGHHHRRHRILAIVAVALAAGASLAGTTAVAQAPTPTLVASLEHIGTVDLGLFGAPDADVRFTEVIGGREPRLLGEARTGPAGFAPLLKAVTWRCDRRSRVFVAAATTTSGTQETAFEVRTPSCAGRVGLTVPRYVPRRARTTIRLTDRWGLGDRRVRLCVSGAGLGHSCELLKLPAGKAGVVRRVRPPRSGRLRVVVALDAHRTVQRVGVGSAPPARDTSAPVLLATGDSTIEGIDSYVGERLSRVARTVSASRPGTGLSKAVDATWPQIAASQVRSHRPRVTMLSLGANDGFPMTTAAGTTVTCCGDDWLAEYVQRARELMGVFTRDDGLLLWLDLPVPRDERKAQVIARVNLAVRQAAEGVEDVRVVDLTSVITPGGVYTESLRRNGKDVRVRAQDGLHLSNAGASIAADEVLRTLRATGWLGSV